METKASLLIADALSLADLTNTSFPTARENRLYINNAYAKVYQQAIDNGEKYYFETAEAPFTVATTTTTTTTEANPEYVDEETTPDIPATIQVQHTTTTTTTTYELPEDFYQLYDIKDSHNNRIPRKQRNSKPKDRWYDIVGGRLVVSEPLLSKPLAVEYWPKPIELNPDEEGDVVLDYPNHIFYQILTLELALYYKIKQGADISGIELMIQDAWDTYYDILSCDNDQPMTITDVREDYINGIF